VTASPRPVICGLGMTEMGKVYGHSATELAVHAVEASLVDAGLRASEVDGVLINPGLTGALGLSLIGRLPFGDLNLAAEMQLYGATAGAMIATASRAVLSGTASTVVCVFADAPLREDRGAGASYAAIADGVPTGFEGLRYATGVRGANERYALATSRHMAVYGTTSEHLGHVAVGQRRWAAMNPAAQMRSPLSLDQHQESRWIVEPLHLYDCCLVSNGAIAVVVTSAERAADLRHRSVGVEGWGQGHPRYEERAGGRFGLESGAVESGRRAMGMAGVTTNDIDLCQIYDCYTFTVLLTLEDYGFCEKGEGGPFAASGALAPDGALPTNTGGGQLSGFYMWGMTPLSEAIIQLRGDAGERQVSDSHVALVSGNGGALDFHSTLVLAA